MQYAREQESKVFSFCSFFIGEHLKREPCKKRNTVWTFIKMNGNTHIKYENKIEHWASNVKKKGKHGKHSQRINHYLSQIFHA